MDYLEIIGTAVGLVYLWLEYRASIWLWVAGVVMPAIYLPVYYDAGLYADFGISVYYLLASLYGLICWLTSRHRPSQPAEEKRIILHHTPAALYPRLAALTLLLFVVIAWILTRFTDSTVPLADSFTTSLSIVAMWMLARKYAEQWIAWIIVDAVSSVLYIYKGLPFTSGLYALYAVIAVFGYRKWLRIIKTSS